MKGWLWMLRKFGIRRTVWYWRQGQRRGWWPEHRVHYVQRLLDLLKREE